MADIESLMNDKIKDSQKAADTMKAQLEMSLSSHESSIRGLGSSAARMARGWSP